MYMGAVAELAAVIIVVVTASSVQAAIMHRHPGVTAAQWHAVLAQLVLVEVAAPLFVGLWLWLAWANGRGHDWARVAFMAFFALLTLGLLTKLGEGAAAYAPADLIANAILWLVGLAVMVLIFSKQSGPYYRPQLAGQQLAGQ